MLTGFLITLGVLLALALAPVLLPLLWICLVGTFAVLVFTIKLMINIIVAPFVLIKEQFSKE